MEARERREIDELIRIVYVNFARRDSNKVTKKQILKILYLAKMDMPDDNPLKQKLAYYWYLQGPTSNLVYSAHEAMVSDRTILRTHSTFELYSYSNGCLHRRLVPHDDHISDASSLIARHVGAFLNTDSLVSEVYEKYSPSQFYPEYRLGFKNKFESFCKNILDGKKETGLVDKNSILESLRGAIVSVPHGDEFFGFRSAFNRYASSLYLLLDAMHDRQTRGDFELALELCDDVWTTFAYGIRLCEHDSYYNSSVGSWQQQYEESVKSLQEKTERLSRSVERLPVPNRRLAPDVEEMIRKADQNRKPKSETFGIDEYHGMLEKIPVNE